MKIQKYINLGKMIGAFVGVLAVHNANGQFSAVSRTTDVPGGVFQNRLFSDNGFTTLAPVNSLIWFVADGSGNGVPTSPLEGGILGADDTLLFQDTVDGTLIGSQAGRYSRTFNGSAAPLVPELARNANIVVYLWNVTGTPGVVTSGFYNPVAGNTFGIFSLGNPTEPAIGDAIWDITANLSGAQFVVNAVPEPSTYLLSGLGVLGMIAYRRFKK